MRTTAPAQIGARRLGRLALGLAGAALAALAPLPASADDAGPATRLEGELTKLADEASRSVVAVRARRGGQLGSGIVVSEEGHILTSTSVVPRGAGSIRVTFHGGATARAREVARDEAHGGSVLLLESSSARLHVATLGESADLAPGAPVASIGNPFGTLTNDGQPAMSLGVVSGLYPMPGERERGTAIETDAAVNPGSFGGPIVDPRGRVVGMVVPAYRNDRWLGLARPIDELKPLIGRALRGEPDLVETPAPAPRTPTPAAMVAADRGVLGIFIYKDDETPGGARLERVQDGGPAAKAGLRTGDVVKRFNGRNVETAKALAGMLGDVKAGQKVDLRVERDGWFKDVTLTAALHPDASTGKPYLGVFLSAQDGALVVDRLADDSPAAKAGLKTGDRLPAFESTEALAEFMKDKRAGQTIELLVERDGWQRRLKITLGSRPGDAPRAEAPTPAPTPRPAPPAPAPAPKRPGFLGVYLQNASPGVKITNVIEGSPAQKAGLQVDDVIVKVNDDGITDLESLTDKLSAFGAGDRVRLGVARSGQAVTVRVELGERPGQIPAPTPTPAPRTEAPKKPGYLGVYLEAGDGGLLVTQVIAGSPSDKAGIKAADLILNVEGRAVPTIEAFGAALSGRGAGDAVVLGVRRGDAKQTITVVLGERPAVTPEPPMNPIPAPTPAPRTERPREPGYLGVYLEPAAGGLAVSRVIEGSPAEAAGLQQGDVITHLAGAKVSDVESFASAIRGYGAGDAVAMSVVRGDAKKAVEVTLGRRPGEAPPAPRRPEPPVRTERRPGYLGVSVLEEAGALKVIQIAEQSPAAAAGLALDEVIVSVEGMEVHSIDDLAAALKDKHAGDKVTMVIQAGGKTRKVEVTLGTRP